MRGQGTNCEVHADKYVSAGSGHCGPVKLASGKPWERHPPLGPRRARLVDALAPARTHTELHVFLQVCARLHVVKSEFAGLKKAMAGCKVA